MRFFISMFLLFCIFVLFSSSLLSFVVIRCRCVFGVVRLMRRPFLSLRLASDSNTASSRTGALSCGRRKVRERKTESEERSKETYTSGKQAAVDTSARFMPLSRLPKTSKIHFEMSGKRAEFGRRRVCVFHCVFSLLLFCFLVFVSVLSSRLFCF